VQLTQWTDYSLRVLMYCARNTQRDAPITITEILDKHEISKSHLTKIVSFLSNSGYLSTTRGRNGGISIAKQAKEITVGEIVRLTESNFEIVECFNKKRTPAQLHLPVNLNIFYKTPQMLFLQSWIK